MTECLGSVAILLLLALTFETGLVAEGLWATAALPGADGDDDRAPGHRARRALSLPPPQREGPPHSRRRDGPAALGQHAHAHDLRTDGPRPAALLPLRGSGGLLLHGRHPPAHHHLRLSHQAALRPRVPRRRATGGGPYAGRFLPPRTTIAHT